MTTVLAESERRLLLRCAQPWRSPEIAEYEKALKSVRDWDLLISVAREQQVLPLLHRVLEANQFEGISQAQITSVRTTCMHNAARNLLLTRELLRLLNLFKDKEINVIPYKGPIIAQHLYGNLSLRQFKDLDILVAPETFEVAREILISEGYQSISKNVLWEETFVHPKSKIAVDLHRGVGQRYFTFRWKFDELWERRQHVKLLGQKIATFSEEDLLLVLAVQITKDCHHLQETLIKFCDPAMLLQRSKLFNWNEVFIRAGVLGCRRFLILCIGLVRQLLKVEVPEAVRVSANRNWTIRAYNRRLMKWQILQGREDRKAYDLVLRWFVTYNCLEFSKNFLALSSARK